MGTRTKPRGSDSWFLSERHSTVTTRRVGRNSSVAAPEDLGTQGYPVAGMPTTAPPGGGCFLGGLVRGKFSLLFKDVQVEATNLTSKRGTHGWGGGLPCTSRKFLTPAVEFAILGFCS